ncbi:sulfite exporter TauE/SafE family protein [Microbacterium sp. Bi98]|uniref:sulfite exporter TauE/SafE family protein n=1 Tax=Microbacterium sp. Bi98 TaxID=2821116 RepID=UPI001E2906AE|nr:sulfite exporter TauE/SafE family protein [Microbacterium sp. Bi98]
MTLAVLVGVALGLLGGGGSILTVPIFTFVLGIGTKEAIASSLFVVAVTGAVSAATRLRQGEVRWKVAGVFAAAGVIGGVAGGLIGQLLPAPVLTALFAAIMIVTAITMMRPRRQRTEHLGRTPTMLGTRMMATGLGVGVLTGALGAGGGFLLVPAFTFLGLPIAAAVGTSLLVIAANSSAGFVTQIASVAINWPTVLAFTALAINGSFIGMVISRRLSAAALRTAFGVLVLAVGVTMLATVIIPTISA